MEGKYRNMSYNKIGKESVDLIQLGQGSLGENGGLFLIL
jgi:hypothetical protein